MMRWFDGPTEEAAPPPPDPRDKMLRYFQYAHLKPELQGFSKPFGDMAAWMMKAFPPGPEATMAMRKLLEAKDCAVRAALDAPKEAK